MKKVRVTTQINARPQKVWDVLWKDKTYREWTAVFHPGSYASSDWEEGGAIRFLSPEGDGMLSEIAEKKPNEFMSFRHLGIIKDGKEIKEGPEVDPWKGCLENYRLKEIGGITQLEVELDINDEHEKYFSETFPKAIEKVKEIAERND